MESSHLARRIKQWHPFRLLRAAIAKLVERLMPAPQATSTVLPAARSARMKSTPCHDVGASKGSPSSIGR
jgi:hypothetical protein